MSTATNPIVITSTMAESSQPLAEREDQVMDDESEQPERSTQDPPPDEDMVEEVRDEDEVVQQEEDGEQLEEREASGSGREEESEGRISSVDEDQDMAEDDDEEDEDRSEQGSSRSRQLEYDTASDSESEDDRDPSELATIALEIRDLEAAVPLLRDSYHLIDRLGEGTFSSVYKAIDLHHTLYDNTRWAPPSPPDSMTGGSSHEDPMAHPSPFDAPPTPPRTKTSPQDPFAADHGDTPRNEFAVQLQQQAIASGKIGSSVKSRPSRKGPVYVALKRIYVTSSPQRILNELELLADLREARNVAYLIQAIRHEDQVIAVMPYQRHQDFRQYYRTASLSLIRSYLRCIFSALADSHAKSIIHRDVKPANFLFDVRTRQGYLCDFGLAERLDPAAWHGKCLHSLPYPGKGDLHGHQLDKPISTFVQLRRQWQEWEAEHPNAAPAYQNKPVPPEVAKTKPWYPTSQEECNQIVADSGEHAVWQEAWRPASHGGLLGGGYGRSSGPTAHLERVGVKKDDQRPSVRANRAGTRGFRAPEVLFKCPDQTVALDVWSVGMIMLCFLTRRFPFFNSNDDTEALLELGALLGRQRLEAGAIQHNRTITTNIPHATMPSWANLHELVRTLNPSLYAECRPGPGRTSKQAIMREHKAGVNIDDDDTLDPFDEAWYDGSELWHAVQLMRATLMVDCTKRLTAAKALRHPFFTKFGKDL